MNVRFGPGSVIFGMMAFLLVALAPADVLAQDQAQGRFKVLIPHFTPMGDTDDGPGKKMAEELRDLINDLPTHQPVEKGELKDALKRFDIDEDDLNCISAVQLANQINAAVVVCGEYTELADGTFEVKSTFRTPGADETFDVDPFTVPEKDAHKTASQQIATAFETLAQQQRHARFCAEYAQSQQWDNAMTNCNSAIDLNPEGTGSIYTRGAVYMNQEMFAEALADFERVLEINPMHENAMQGAGYTSAKLGNEEAARSYYNQYLELNPANASVRMNVAFELAKAGDPYGAMQMIEEGIELDAENVDLWEQLGGYAFAAAAANGSEDITPETEALYRRAIEAYNHVFEAKGSDANVTQIRNVIAAHVRLDEVDQAIALAERSMATHGDEPALLSTYADALEKAERRPEAIEQIRQVIALDPTYRNAKARLGKWLLDEGNTDEAIPVLRDAVASGDETGDRIANVLFADGYQNGIQPRNFNHADEMFRLASEFAESERMQRQVGFWSGFAAYRLGEALQEPQNLENARRALPYFQRARQLFQANRAYADEQDGIDINRLIEASGTYIEIQEAIIQRGG